MEVRVLRLPLGTCCCCCFNSEINWLSLSGMCSHRRKVGFWKGTPLCQPFVEDAANLGRFPQCWGQTNPGTELQAVRSEAVHVRRSRRHSPGSSQPHAEGETWPPRVVNTTWLWAATSMPYRTTFARTHGSRKPPLLVFPVHSLQYLLLFLSRLFSSLSSLCCSGGFDC